MKYSIINITSCSKDSVEGHWIQNHIGSLESASKLAAEYERLGNVQLGCAVVDELPNTNPLLSHYTNLKRLDSDRSVIRQRHSESYFER